MSADGYLGHLGTFKMNLVMDSSGQLQDINVNKISDLRYSEMAESELPELVFSSDDEAEPKPKPKSKPKSKASATSKPTPAATKKKTATVEVPPLVAESSDEDNGE